MRFALPSLLFALLALSACSRPTSPPTQNHTPEQPGSAAATAAPIASAALPPGEASAPAASTPPPPARPPGRVAFETKADDVAWVRGLRRSKGFRRLKLPAAEGPLLVTWRAHPQRRRPDALPDLDMPSDYAGRFELALTQGAAGVTLNLGVHSGSPNSLELTYCQRQNFKLVPNAEWRVPRLPNLVSSFSAATSPSSNDYLLVAGPGALYVVYRPTHDGECPTLVRQGPLETCDDMKYELLSEIRFAGEARGEETIEVLEASGARPPFDCTKARDGDDLRAP